MTEATTLVNDNNGNKATTQLSLESILSITLLKTCMKVLNKKKNSSRNLWQT